MNYYLVAGEASGDLHGSNLMKEIRRQDGAASFRFWGGDLMENAGGTLVKHYRDLAFMGFIEVVANIRTIMNNLKLCKKDILQHRPDVLILIDYPGFNLRIAKWARKQGLKIVYYISPQVWAWKQSRVHTIKESVDRMIVILPFEKEFYKKWNYEVDYVGHPLTSVVSDFKKNAKTTAEELIKGYEPKQWKGIVALLPGSRKQEIIVKLPVMLAASEKFPDLCFVIAKAPSVEPEFYNTLISHYKNVKMIDNKTYALLTVAKAALVTSGTATLETALFGVPQVICYKGSAVSYHIAKRLVKIKYIGLVNLIMNKEVVKELIQDQLTVENISRELDSIIRDEGHIRKIKDDYASLKSLLTQGGDASEKAASIITQLAAS